MEEEISSLENEHFILRYPAIALCSHHMIPHFLKFPCLFLLRSKHIEREIQWGRGARSLTKKMLEKLFAGTNLEQLNKITHDQRKVHTIQAPTKEKCPLEIALRFCFLYLGSKAKDHQLTSSVNCLFIEFLTHDIDFLKTN